MVGCSDRNTLHLQIVSDENSAPVFGVIPRILGVAFLAPLCVSWRHIHWQCCSLRKFDSMEALTADKPAMFAEITVSAIERF